MPPRPLLGAWGVALLVAAALLPAARCIKVRVITNATDADFVYPEINPKSQFYIDSLLAKPSLGIALSGGGGGGQWRAAALAYGWLRAMYLMNVTNSAQYISANSGGSWVAVPYAYTTAPMSRFFAPYYEPHNLTVARLSLSSNPGSWAAYAAGKTLRTLGNPVTAPGEPSSWANHLASIFLAPFGLGSSDSSVSAAGTKGDLLRQTKKRLSPMFRVHVACTNNRPFPITTAAIMSPEKASPKFFPWEFTPLYAGMPAVALFNKPTVLGGGFVETVAFNSNAPRKKAVSKTGEEVVDVALKHPTPTSSLVHMVGMSSSETALNRQPTNRLTANLFNGQLAEYWNLVDYKQHEYLFVDGAAVDDLAIMPLLRRGVKNIVACVATRAEPNGTKQQFATEEFALAGLFGALPLDAKGERGQPLLIHGVDEPMAWNDQQQVFRRDDFDDLFADYKASYEAGEAHVFAHTHEVLPNTFMGVAGGYQVNVLWVLNGRSSQWEDALQEQTRRWLAKQREAAASGGATPYQDYPNVHHAQEAPAPLVSLLSQQASWAFRFKKSLVADFLAAAAGSASGPGEEVIRGNEWR